MERRRFVQSLAAAIALPTLPALPAARPAKKLSRIGIQLYTFRDDARKDLERTLADIASVGYTDVEMLGSMRNFDMPPAKIRQVLDRLHLRAPSTHVGANILDDLPRALDEAHTLGHQYLIIASLPGADMKTLDGYRKWADRMNAAGAEARKAGVWVGFHNHQGDFQTIDGKVAYDVFVERTDPSVVRMQLDTGNLAMAGRDPMVYLDKFGSRYWSFHIKDVPKMGATEDVELGKGIIDFKKLLAKIGHLDQKLLFVEQETYPGAVIDSARRDFQYLKTLAF
jgi:sugar phosphate isomerase/epimerase